MKEWLLMLCIVMASLGNASAQGTIRMFNVSADYLIYTNGGPIGTDGHSVTVRGLLSTAANSYYFALLISDTGTRGTWSVAQSGGVDIVGVNTTYLAGGFTGTGGPGGVAVDGWTAGTAKYVQLVGWSASLGTTYRQIADQLGNRYFLADGYYGVSSIGLVTSGGVGIPVTPPGSLFSLTGISSGFDLNGYILVPEPTTITLAVLGAVSLRAFQRRK